MSTADITNYSNAFGIDQSLVEYEDREITTQTTDLNISTDVRFDITNRGLFTHPSNSYLLVEGQLQLHDGAALPNDRNSALAKEGILHLFDSISYSLNEKTVEFINYPGVCQSMLSYVLESDEYDRYQSSAHCGQRDDAATATDATNNGFKRRRALLQNADPRGSFSYVIPLKRLFGFFRDYNKVIFGTTQSLSVKTKGNSSDAIFRENVGGDAAARAAAVCRVHLTKMRWYVPHVVGSDEINLALNNKIKSKSPFDIAYRGLTVERMDVPANTTSFTWQLGSKMAPEVPRYILLGFQTDKEGNQLHNASVFDHVNLSSLYVDVDGKHFPSRRYEPNFTTNKFARIYADAMKFKDKFYNVESTENDIVSKTSIDINAYKALFPVFVVDLSKQQERARFSSSNVSVQAKFSNNVPADTRAFTVIISDNFVKLESDGNQLIRVQ